MSMMRRVRTEVDRPNWLLRGRRLFDWPERWSELLESATVPVEEFEEEGEMVVRADVPGIDPDRDVEITVSDHTLNLKIERRQQTKAEDKKHYRSELRYGSFARKVQLAAGATEVDVKATYQDGVLEVRIPINADRAEAKRVPIARA